MVIEKYVRRLPDNMPPQFVVEQNEVNKPQQGQAKAVVTIGGIPVDSGKSDNIIENLMPQRQAAPPPQIVVAPEPVVAPAPVVATEDQFKSDAPFKYGEFETLVDILNYIGSTYEQHYVGKNNVQMNDLVLAQEPAEAIGFWKFNAAKYVVRYGKKKGRNRQDLMKAVHYLVLLLYLDEQLNKESE